MASLALLACGIFFFVLFSGPLAVLFRHLNFGSLALLFSLFAMSAGVFWCVSMPFPVSAFGAFSIFCGLYALLKH
jgi:hypothetical protein